MAVIRTFKRITAFIMLLLTLHVIADGVMTAKDSLEPLKERARQVATLTSDDDSDEPGLDDFKPPKHTFIDYSTYFLPHWTAPIFHPRMASLTAIDHLRLTHQFYPDVPVPPDNRA
jgi:hypothetical protein